MRVLFIGGAPRSGSTLLGRVLGAVPGFVHVGELNFIWERGLRDNHLCGCGKPFAECAFWSEVLTQTFGSSTLPPGEVDALIRERRRADYMPTAMFTLTRIPGRRRVAGYLDVTQRLLAAIRRVSGAEVIVDSSKRASHGLVLSEMADVDLYCLHIVRDSRAYCFSTQRRRRRPEIHWDVAYMPTGRPWRQALRWDVHNFLVASVARRSTRAARIRYEDFAESPLDAADRILRELKLAAVPSHPERDSEVLGGEPVSVRLMPEHTVSGNPMRFQTGRVLVRTDDEWRGSMAARDRCLVTGLSAPLLWRYGYI